MRDVVEVPKRTICIQNPALLSIQNNALAVLQQDELKGLIPLEDIWVLIIETQRAKVTTAALSRLVNRGISVVICGDDHMPNGLLLPLGIHSRYAEIVEDQLTISKPLQKRLWQGIVKAKIVNQATVLELLGMDASTVRNISKDVLSGDSSNRESVAASAYFRRLLPTGTRRVGGYSSALDYGYTVLRAGIGRMAVCGGWLVSRGIHHSNNLNAFNLVDDLIEPFRPVVDLMVVSEEMRGELVPEMKKKLASIFEILVRTSVGDVPLQIAIEAEMSSLKTAVRNHDARALDLPQVLPLRSSVQE